MKNLFEKFLSPEHPRPTEEEIRSRSRDMVYEALRNSSDQAPTAIADVKRIAGQIRNLSEGNDPEDAASNYPGYTKKDLRKLAEMLESECGIGGIIFKRTVKSRMSTDEEVEKRLLEKLQKRPKPIEGVESK